MTEKGQGLQRWIVINAKPTHARDETITYQAALAIVNQHWLPNSSNEPMLAREDINARREGRCNGEVRVTTDGSKSNRRAFKAMALLILQKHSSSITFAHQR